MSKNTILTILVSVLLLINICTIGFLIMGKKHGHQGPIGERNHHTLDETIQKNFQFDEGQMAQFEVSKASHMQSVNSLREILDDNSQKYYKVPSTDKAKRDSLISLIEKTTADIYEVNQKHFDEIRKICRPEQLTQMDNFIDMLLTSPIKRAPQGPPNMNH